MPAFEPNPACLQDATERRTELAASKVRMFKSTLTPTPATTLAELEAAEADFGGYSEVTLTTWGLPILAPSDGYAIYSPSFQFNSTPADPVELQDIGGLYLVDSDGNLRGVYQLDTPVSMGGPGQGYVGQWVIYFRTGYTGAPLGGGV